MLQAARRWRALDEEIARVTRAKEWATEQRRWDDAAKHTATLDGLYAESYRARTSLMDAVDNARPQDACPQCGSPTVVVETDDGMAGVELYGCIQRGEEWTERQCTECDWSEEMGGAR